MKMRIISLFAFILVSTSLLSESYHAKAIGIDSASHGLVYDGRVVRRYGATYSGLQERADPTPKDPKGVASPPPPPPPAPAPKNKDIKAKGTGPTQQKGANPQPPNSATTQQTDDSTDPTLPNQDQSDPAEVQGGTPTVATGGITQGGIIGICAVGGVVLLVGGLFAFSQRKKNKEITKSIVSSSAKAWEQQNSAYETIEEESKPIGSYIVTATYTPTLSDELDIQPGDKVTILVEYDDGWVQGINETRGGTKGVFPRHCVDMSSHASSKNNKRSSSMGGFTERYTEVDLN